ncbi:MAG: hypothetical protein KA886_00125 [Candidatus Cloacimonetes bacterium]|nr:hypothetical protein [Candidatus Cloacimonadota bacterium]
MKLIKYILFSVLIIYFQVLFLSGKSFLGASLYLPLALVIYISIKLNYISCMTITLFQSMIWDVFCPQLLGLNVILNIVVCHLVFIYHSNINKEKFLSVLFSVLLINLLYFFGYWLYYIISYQNPNILVLSSILSVLINTFANVFLLYLLVLTDKLKIIFYEDAS